MLIIGLFISCKFQNPTAKKAVEEEKEEAKILSLFIDEMAIPFPLPPMPSEKNLEKTINEMNWDSIKKATTTVVIDTIMFETNTKSELPAEFTQYRVLVDSIGKLSSKPMKKQRIKSKEGHHLIFGNSLDDFQGKYPQMVSMSRVVFNEDYNYAAVYAGHSSGKLAGYLNLYLLEKKEGVWQIVFQKNVEVS